MSRRKDGLSPQERLARLAGSARPVSEHSQGGGPQPVEAEEREELSVTPVVSPVETSTVTSFVTPFVTPDVTTQDASHDTEQMTEHVSSLDPRHVSYPDPSHVPAHDSVHATSPGAEREAAHAEREVQLTARVRGRWTPEQLAFIKRVAKDQRATAGEVLRHVVAWYLEDGLHLHSSGGRTLAPSARGLVRRETGLKLLDFMTTQQQEAAIKKTAAGYGGEAALLRLAIDTYQEHGPLIKRGS